MATIARNEPCPCGSGKKHKKCCLGKSSPESIERRRKAFWSCVVIAIVAIAVAIFVSKAAATTLALIGFGLVGFLLLFTDPPPPSQGGNPSAINFGG